ncbi:hypothetical protein BD293_0039 [Roseinatronobacter monicus]|uniref:Uncharacterized protein n=2 Tax=Roseinatronobacter monicus TaxID=393481 RepID=A0A543K8S7_9RHOB|nr:hypothetical protein BD293_3782 [Roseinatronobacter monicus]TQM91488.1 hypothetical protein BD293_0039 [Roseinatronobacter monicus]
MPEDNLCNPMAGVTDLGDGLTVVDIWQGLHANAKAWPVNPYGLASAAQNRTLIDGTDLSVLRALAAYPGAGWSALCTAAGWTSYGAVALSWCQGATLPQVLDAWLASGFSLKPLPEYERPARLLNPTLLPQTRSLSALVEAAQPNAFALCVMIAHSPEPLDFDMSLETLQSVPQPQLAAFFKSRMLQKPVRSPDEDQLIVIWTATVKGTEFDIWEAA